jgi:elongation factor P
MMQTVLPSEFKRGMDLMVGGAPEVLEEFHFSGTAQTKPRLHARLRHLKTGRLTEHTFAESERVPIADAQYRRVQFSYHHGENYVFSDVETFEELTLSAEQIGERRLFIKENEEYRALFMVPLFIAPGGKNPRGYDRAQICWTRKRGEQVRGKSRHIVSRRI